MRNAVSSMAKPTRISWLGAVPLLIFTIFYWFFTPAGAVFAAPAPEYFVIHEDDRQCGIYWAGDEFSHSALPSGWKIYEPEQNLILETPFGACDYKYTSDPEAYYSQCCSQLGFTYVSYTEVPYTTEDAIKFNESGWKCSPEPGDDYSHGVLINEKNNECTTLISFALRKPNKTAFPTEGQCSITDPNWKAHLYEPKSSSKIVTPFGECNDLDTDGCCKQLGLTNVGRNLTGSITKDNDQISGDENAIDADRLKDSSKKNYISMLGGFIILMVVVLSGFVVIKRVRRKKEASQPIVTNLIADSGEHSDLSNTTIDDEH